MYRLLILLFAVFFSFSSCHNSYEDSAWNRAEWIALEHLPDSMKIVPGVHGNGNSLGDRGLKRSVVPMFRKEFRVNKGLKNASINITGLGHYELT